jgi:hypothetical protein
MLIAPENLAALADLPGRWIDAVHDRRPPKTVTLDMDSSESPVHGEQEGSAWNGHFQSKCLHPLFVFNQFGDLERCALRPGNVHSADGWEHVLRPVLARYTTACAGHWQRHYSHDRNSGSIIGIRRWRPERCDRSMTRSYFSRPKRAVRALSFLTLPRRCGQSFD